MPESPALIDRFEEAIEGFAEKRYAIIDQFLPEADWVKKLENRALWRFANGDFNEAGIGRGEGHQVEQTIRGDHIFWLDAASEFEGERYFLATMDHFAQYLNKTCFTGIQFHEFHFAIYPPGTFYQRHIDRFRNGDSRLFSVVFYLNEDWQEADGGQLVLYPEGKDPVTVLPIANRLAFFDSALLEHEVLEAHRDRLSVTGWFRR